MDGEGNDDTGFDPIPEPPPELLPEPNRRNAVGPASPPPVCGDDRAMVGENADVGENTAEGEWAG